MYICGLKKNDKNLRSVRDKSPYVQNIPKTVPKMLNGLLFLNFILDELYSTTCSPGHKFLPPLANCQNIGVNGLYIYSSQNDTFAIRYLHSH